MAGKGRPRSKIKPGKTTYSLADDRPGKSRRQYGEKKIDTYRMTGKELVNNHLTIPRREAKPRPHKKVLKEILNELVSEESKGLFQQEWESILQAITETRFSGFWDDINGIYFSEQATELISGLRSERDKLKNLLKTTGLHPPIKSQAEARLNTINHFLEMAPDLEVERKRKKMQNKKQLASLLHNSLIEIRNLLQKGGVGYTKANELTTKLFNTAFDLDMEKEGGAVRSSKATQLPSQTQESISPGTVTLLKPELWTVTVYPKPSTTKKKRTK